jgi:hypothetical protein
MIASAFIAFLGLIVILISTGFCGVSRQTAAQQFHTDRGIALLSTVLFMSGWMFVNWCARRLRGGCLPLSGLSIHCEHMPLPNGQLSMCRADVYFSLLFLVPSLLMSGVTRLRACWMAGLVGWFLVNPWAIAMASTATARISFDFAWLQRVSFITYIFVWSVYVPCWASPWLSLGYLRQNV